MEHYKLVEDDSSLLNNFNKENNLDLEFIKLLENEVKDYVSEDIR